MLAKFYILLKQLGKPVSLSTLFRRTYLRFVVHNSIWIRGQIFSTSSPMPNEIWNLGYAGGVSYFWP